MKKKIEVGDKFRYNHPNGSLGEIVHIVNDGTGYYARYYYGTDVGGRQVTASSNLLSKYDIILISNEEFQEAINRRFG